MGCDHQNSPVSDICSISIHAPQWGATTHRGTPCLLSGISIHAPQWGATVVNANRVTTLWYFNPRTPVGCDAHPQWEAVRASYFNPRTPVGCDNVYLVDPIFHLKFQSTHPSGVRRPVRVLAAQSQISIHAPQWGATRRQYARGRFRWYFNPRTPVGCDRFIRKPSSRNCLFQSTHPSGVRPMTPLTSISRPEFQSTHPSGVRPREWA